MGLGGFVRVDFVALESNNHGLRWFWKCGYCWFGVHQF